MVLIDHEHHITATRLLCQKIIQVNNKENTKVTHYYPFVW